MPLIADISIKRDKYDRLVHALCASDLRYSKTQQAFGALLSQIGSLHLHRNGEMADLSARLRNTFATFQIRVGRPGASRNDSVTITCKVPVPDLAAGNSVKETMAE